MANLAWRLMNGQTYVNHAPKVSVVMIGTNDLGFAACFGGEPNITAAAPGTVARYSLVPAACTPQLPATLQSLPLLLHAVLRQQGPCAGARSGWLFSEAVWSCMAGLDITYPHIITGAALRTSWQSLSPQSCGAGCRGCSSSCGSTIQPHGWCSSASCPEEACCLPPAMPGPATSRRYALCCSADVTAICTGLQL